MEKLSLPMFTGCDSVEHDCKVSLRIMELKNQLVAQELMIASLKAAIELYPELKYELDKILSQHANQVAGDQDYRDLLEEYDLLDHLSDYLPKNDDDQDSDHDDDQDSVYDDGDEFDYDDPYESSSNDEDDGWGGHLNQPRILMRI